MERQDSYSSILGLVVSNSGEFLYLRVAITPITESLSNYYETLDTPVQISPYTKQC